MCLFGKDNYFPFSDTVLPQKHLFINKNGTGFATHTVLTFDQTN